MGEDFEDLLNISERKQCLLQKKFSHRVGMKLEFLAVSSVPELKMMKRWKKEMENF